MVWLKRTRLNYGGIVPIYKVQQFKVAAALIRDPALNPDYEPFAEQQQIPFGDCIHCPSGGLYHSLRDSHEHLIAGPMKVIVSRMALGIRDCWKCGICGEPVDPSLRSPDPRSASVDHIHPKALGGLDQESNVQIAHLRCNVRKG